MARSTQLSYRDTLAKVIRYAAYAVGKRPDLLNVDDLSRELITQFLPSTASNKGLTARTINQRLAALHTFARFVGEYDPEHLEWSGRILSIPFRKFARPQIPYLEKPEMEALLAATDMQTAQGIRDHALLLFLYNTGSRAAEAAQICSCRWRAAPATRSSSCKARVERHGFARYGCVPPMSSHH
ncbi:tyrosine-type recombinase/integrase [Pseudomonas sp. TCU-HL1]|uniref:tyrosine-type recombinase/integrase n=1 Tax=Pseudomonas sp. TCU-HL1 TaxID=1856685 RepID=UPI001930EA8C